MAVEQFIDLNEIELSGNARYKVGKEYVKYLLKEIDLGKDPLCLIGQVKNLAVLETISEAVATAITNFLELSQNR